MGRKGIYHAGSISTFSGQTVPLTRFEKFVWETDETFQASAEVAHFGPEPLDERPAARQLRKSLFEYMRSDEFNPGHSVEMSIIQDIFRKQSERLNFHTNESTDDLKPETQNWPMPIPCSLTNNMSLWHRLLLKVTKVGGLETFMYV